MSSREILEQALNLRPEERFAIVEGLLESLDVPDPEIDAAWLDEAEKRLQMYRQGKLRGIPMEQVFRDDA